MLKFVKFFKTCKNSKVDHLRISCWVMMLEECKSLFLAREAHGTGYSGEDAM